MKKLIITILSAAAFAAATFVYAQVPPMPEPTKEHEWLKQFVGEWESELEAFMEPGKPTVKSKGTEVCRAIGGLWVIGEGKTDMGGMTYGHLLTLGYDPEKKKYIGTLAMAKVRVMPLRIFGSTFTVCSRKFEA